MSSSINSSPRILSAENWKTLYSDEDYKQTETRGKPYLFHFLIARNANEADLIGRIKSGKNPEKLTVHDPKNHKLTPLIIATMRGNEKVAEALLSQEIVRKNINAADEYGWTALHHAKFSSEAIYQMLMAANANQENQACQTNLYGSPDDLKTLTAEGVKAGSLSNVSFEGKALTEERAKEAFGMKAYRDISFFPAQYLKNLWQQEKSVEEPLINRVVEAFKSRSPKFVISSIAKDFYTLTAEEDLEAGTLIGEYGGIFRKTGRFSFFPFAFPVNNEAQSGYQFSIWDAREVGNLTRFINCGFGNVSALPYVQNGINKVIFVAYDKILKGQPILFNYGAKAYEVTYAAPQILFNRDEIHNFFKKGLKNIEKEIQAADKEAMAANPMNVQIRHYLKRLNVRDHSLFPLDNPMCLIDLHVSGIVPAKDWLKVLMERNEIIVLEWVKAHGLITQFYLMELAIRVEQLDRDIKKNAPDHYPLFLNWVQGRCQTLKIMDLMKGMDWIEEALVTEKNPKLIDEIDERLKSYDWTKDESNFYSYENRRKTIEKHLSIDLIQTSEKTEEFLLAFTLQRKLHIESLENVMRESGDDFAGSEIEKMLHEIKENLPKDFNDGMRSLETIFGQAQEITSLYQ